MNTYENRFRRFFGVTTANGPYTGALLLYLTIPTCFRTHHHGRSPSGSASISALCFFAAATMRAAAKKQRAEIDALPEGERPWWCVRKHVGMVK